MGHRTPARFLAPLAIIAVLIGVFAIVQASRSTDSSSDGPARATTTANRPLSRRVGRRATRRRIYVVKAGDSLSVISERTGVPVERIQQLNPDLDAATLVVGQRLRLTP